MQPRYLLLDFRLVTGMDSSAIFAFSRLMQLLQGQEITIVVTHLSEAMLATWEKSFAKEGDGCTYVIFDSLDQGLA